MKGDVVITAMKNGQVKIKGANITVQADEDIDLIAGRNINLNGKGKVLIKGNKVQADGLTGNLVEQTSGSFIQRIYTGRKFDSMVGMDYLAEVGAVAGIGNPAVGLAANVLGSFF